MSWELPITLGGEVSPFFVRRIMRVVPPWLRRRVGGAILRAIGEVLDAMSARDDAGVALRFPTPGVDPGALAIQGRERRIVRGIGEPAATYAGRVQRWLEAHRHRGSVHEMLRQWHAYNGANPRRIDVVYYSGTRYILEVDGTITRDILPNFGGDGTGRWAQAWCFVYEDADPGPLTPEQEAQLTMIPRLWSAAHMLPLKVVVLWPGVGLWDYPPGLWDDPADPWTDDVPIILEAA